jgi:tetratricopeptide (TPR) repeat protein
VKRVLAAAGVVLAFGALVAGTASLVEGLDSQRQYRRLLETGEQALADGDSFAAIEAFSGALALRPESMAAYYRRGEAYRAQNRGDEALANLREANRLAPDAPEPLVALGDLYAARGEAAQAAAWYSQAADRLRDQDPALLYRLALARYQAGATLAAAEPLKRLVARHDTFGEAHYLLGLVYRDSGQDLDTAIASLEQAVRVSPGLTPAREELADLYRARGRHVDEMRQLHALADEDTHVARRLAIALAQSRVGQYDGALRTLHELQAAAPSDSRIQVAIARVLLARAERTPDRASVSRALAALERALGGTARRSEGLALYGRALYLSGDFAGAERILREAVATSPVELDAFQFLADAAARLSHDLVARDALVDLDLLEGATAADNRRSDRARRIGLLSMRAGDPAAAARHLGRAVDAGVSDAATLGQLAHARWLIADEPGAKDALARALAIAPRDPELLRLARTIR